MKIINTLLNDVLILQSDSEINDGVPKLSFNINQLIDLGITQRFVQENQSLSNLNVLRGMHYQEVNPQGKLIQVLRGSIFDVVVDLRLVSSTFGHYASYYLNSQNNEFIWIPPGYAHGFLTLEEHSILHYRVTEYRKPESERTLLWSDPYLNIDWPLDGNMPIISEKDQSGQQFKTIKYFKS
jgi:dTDP-4-dehydrorhamnose 3,5-epimerase